MYVCFVSHPGCIPDSLYQSKCVRDIYELSQDTLGKYTVPILWDTKTKTIVNNESSEIIRMFNGPFARFMKTDSNTVDLYPAHLRDCIDSVNEWIYPCINDGVYKCGFARTQSAYDNAGKQP